MGEQYVMRNHVSINDFLVYQIGSRRWLKKKKKDFITVSEGDGTNNEHLRRKFGLHTFLLHSEHSFVKRMLAGISIFKKIFRSLLS